MHPRKSGNIPTGEKEERSNDYLAAWVRITPVISGSTDILEYTLWIVTQGPFDQCVYTLFVTPDGTILWECDGVGDIPFEYYHSDMNDGIHIFVKFGKGKSDGNEYSNAGEFLYKRGDKKLGKLRDFFWGEG